MTLKLKKLVSELETLISERGVVLDVRAQAELRKQIEDIKTEIDAADIVRQRELALECLQLLGALLNVITNVMTLFP